MVLDSNEVFVVDGLYLVGEEKFFFKDDKFDCVILIGLGLLVILL